MATSTRDTEPGDLLLVPPSPASLDLPDVDGHVDDAVDTALSAPCLSPFKPSPPGEATPRPFEETFYYRELQKMSKSKDMACLTEWNFFRYDLQRKNACRADLLLYEMVELELEFGERETQLYIAERTLNTFSHLFGAFRPKDDDTICFSAFPLRNVFITQRSDDRVSIHVGKSRNQKSWVDVFEVDGRAALFRFLATYIKHFYNRQVSKETRTADAAVKMIVNRAIRATEHSARNRAFPTGRTERGCYEKSPLCQVESTSEFVSTDHDAIMETGPGETNDDSDAEVHGTSQDDLSTTHEDPLEHGAGGLSATMEHAEEKEAPVQISVHQPIERAVKRRVSEMVDASN